MEQQQEFTATRGNIFQTRLNQLMNDTNTTHSALAEHLNLTRQAVSSYLDGKAFPTLEKFYKICSFFDVSSDYLLGFTNSTLKDTTLQQLTHKTGLSSNTVKVLEELWNNGIPPKDNVEFNIFTVFDFPIKSSFHPQYVIEKMLSDYYFINVFPIALLRYCEMKYTHRKELEIYGENTASISYDVKIAKFMLLEEVQRFIDDFYSILTIKLDERTKEVQKFYEKECEKHGKKD